MYQTATVARLAGAMSLFVILATWGLGYLLVSGETTSATWALGLASMFPASAIVLSVVDTRFPRSGKEYAIGLVVGVVGLSVTYIGVASVDYALVSAIATFDPLELVVAALSFGLVVGALALVDRHYVEHPPSAALLEERYLDEPVSDD